MENQKYEIEEDECHENQLRNKLTYDVHPFLEKLVIEVADGNSKQLLTKEMWIIYYVQETMWGNIRGDSSQKYNENKYSETFKYGINQKILTCL